MNVLIVDDSHIVAERLEGMLTGISDEIRVTRHARNVAEGRQAVRCVSPEVIILDIRMPGGSGIELLKELKRDARSPVIIMLTNYPLPQYRDRCLKAGADYFFDKSTQLDQVTEVFRSLLRFRVGASEQPGGGRGTLGPDAG